MDLLLKLEYQMGLSSLEREVADYIIKHKEKVSKMKLQELADVTYISTATISRLCKKIGERSYNDFRMNLIAAISLRNDPLIDFNKPFLAEDSIDQVVNNMGGLYVKTIHDTEQLLDYKVLSEVIDILSVSKVIDVYGVGISYQSAAMFQYKMMSLDQVVRVNHSSNDQIKQAQYSSKDTVAIIISYSGETREICEIVDEIKKREGTIIAITSTHKNYLRIRSNYCLTLCTKEKDEYKLEAFSSKISADYIMDLIYSMLFQKKYNVYLDDKRERTHQING